MDYNYTDIAAGMTGAQLIEIINGNSNISKLQFESLIATVATLLLGNNVKQVKVEDGKFLYTLDGTVWNSVENNVWGGITGNITDQDDLQSALSAKANASDLNTTNQNVSTLSNQVSGLETTVSSHTTSIAANTTAIGALQTKQAKQVSSDTIVMLRIGSSGFMQYSLDGTTWINVQSVAEINWGAIGGEITNQQDLIQLISSKANVSQLNTHINNTENPHSVTKAQVGLGNVNNTSDEDKPISNAQEERFVEIEGSISDLNNNKMSKTEEVESLEYISLGEWNAKREAGELSDTTIYIVK